jgi:hypothetical protein
MCFLCIISKFSALDFQLLLLLAGHIKFLDKGLWGGGFNVFTYLSPVGSLRGSID